jgi:sugar lactone lactonase YvrE
MVNKANTTTSIMSTVNSSAFGQTVTFTATISANSPGSGTPTGTLQFKDGTNNLGTPVNLINRTATLSTNSLSAGTHSITAVYNSDSNFNSSISGILNFTVTPPVLNHSTLYVADALNNRIQRSTNNGQSWQTVGFGPGTGLGQFNAPKGVTVDSSDSIIFVADTANNRVQRSTDSGATWNAIATAGLATNQVNQPAAVAYDEPTNKLYIADTANNRILVVTNASTTSPTFAIFAGATAGNTLGKFNQPQSVAVNSNGMVYVADTLNNRIQMNSTGLDTGWTILATTGSAIGQVNAPKGMYVDDSGNIWVADTINNRIQVNTNGTWSVFMNAGTAVGTVNHPEGIVVNITGNVFVADTGNNRIQCKPAKGGAATVVGAPGLNIGQFNQPSGIR